MLKSDLEACRASNHYKRVDEHQELSDTKAEITSSVLAEMQQQMEQKVEQKMEAMWAQINKSVVYT